MRMDCRGMLQEWPTVFHKQPRAAPIAAGNAGLCDGVISGGGRDLGAEIHACVRAKMAPDAFNRSEYNRTPNARLKKEKPRQVGAFL